jgi:hypothetical protein
VLVAASASFAVTRHGTKRADRIIGTPKADRLFGRGGRDLVRGLPGRAGSTAASDLIASTRPR